LFYSRVAPCILNARRPPDAKNARRRRILFLAIRTSRTSIAQPKAANEAPATGEQRDQRHHHQHENHQEAVTVPRVTSTPETLDDGEFGQLLADCQLFSAGSRSGLIPFDAACIARRLAARSGHDEQTALDGLTRWAASVGGELDEGALLWPPADQFGGTR
jgi:hypothetical protein